MTKRIPLFLVLMLSILTFGSINMSAVEAQDSTEETTFILHKLLFDFDKMPEEIINDGHVNTQYEDYRMLEGAAFEVYDVTAEYRNEISSGKTITEIQTALAQIDVTDRSEIASGQTDVNGEVSFTLEAPSNEISAYLFHESHVPAGVKERAGNMVVMLPFIDDETNERLSTIHLYPKNESENLPFEKEVIGEIDYEIGERITYEIRTRVPENPGDYTVFRISDLADPVLNFYPDSLIVRIGGDLIDDIVPNGIYELNPVENGFRLEFNPSLLNNYRGEEIVVQYEMALNADAIADVNYLNEGKLEYDNNVLIDREVVRTGGYHFVKVDINNNERTLADAHFILRDSTGNYLVIEDGRYNWVTERADATEFISDEDGLLHVSGLKYGRYYLEEIRAPFRYVLSETPIAFDVMNGTFNPNVAMNIVNQPEGLPDTGGDPEPEVPSRPRLPITRGEDPPAEERPRLPRTGENANIILGALGIMFIVAALVILSNENGKRRKSR